MRWYIRTSVAAGFLAGTVDLFVAAGINRVNPGIVLQAIASGVLGRASFFDGAWSMVAGALLQWAMSIIIAGIYWGAAFGLPILGRRPLAAGALFGVAVHIVMNFVVVPLSRAHAKPHPSAGAIASDMAAMIFFGILIAETPTLLALVRRRR